MLFNSFAFLYFSVAVLLLVIMLRRRSYQHLWLLAASYFFYSYSSGRLVVLLLFSTLLDFYCGRALHEAKEPWKRKSYLIISILGNLGLLGFFKYANFFIENFTAAARTLGYEPGLSLLSIALPIGISFYTFQTMSYTIDIYRREIKPAGSLREFALYVAFFPQLVAGPIVRARDFLPQLAAKVTILPDNFKKGLTLIGWGLVKKIVFADNIAVFANAFFSNPQQWPGSLPALLGALAFGIQIYCDFSGYSDIAIGIARVLGFNLRLNFDKPYFAANITEFWQKWHISLSSWLRDYLYIPLGGNRKGKSRTYLNLMVTMVLGGLWHGAAWNFVFWGFYQGFLLSMHRLLSGLPARLPAKIAISTRIGRILSWRSPLRKVFWRKRRYAAVLLTQYFVFLGWLLFRVSDIPTMLYVVRQYLSFDFSGAGSVLLQLWQGHSIPLFFLLLFLAIHVYTFFHRDFIEKMAERELFWWGLYLFIVGAALYFLSPAQTVQFIYFQF